MTSEWIECVSNGALFILIISIVNLYWHKRFFDKSFSPIRWLLTVNLLVEGACYVCFNHGTNNLPLLHLFTIVEFNLLTFYFLQLSQFRVKRSFQIYIVLANLALVFNSAFIQSIFSFNSFSKSIVQLIIIFMSLHYFINKKKNRSKQKDSQSHNMIVSAILFYYASSLVIFMFSDFALQAFGGLHLGFWTINAFLNFIFQLLILFAIWKRLKVTKYSF